MKRIIVFLAFLFLPLSSFAVSYNGSTMFSLPPVATWSSLYYTFGDAVNFAPTMDLGAWVPYRLINYTSLVRYIGWTDASTFSWLLTKYEFTFDFGCNYNYCWYNQSSLRLYQHFINGRIVIGYTVSNQNCPNQYACNPEEIIETWDLLSLLPSDCPGVTSDCLLVFAPHFNIVSSFVNWGIHLSHFDTYFYLNSEKKSVMNRKYFWTLSDSWEWREPTIWETFINFWGLDTGEYWLNFSVNKTTNLSSMYAYWYSNSDTVSYSYERSSAPSNDETILVDFFAWTWTSLEAYFWDWVGALGYRVTSTDSIDNTSFDISGDLEEVTNAIWPYLKSYISLVSSTLTNSWIWLFDFPTVSINSNRNCMSEYYTCTLYNDIPTCQSNYNQCLVEISQPPDSCFPPFMISSDVWDSSILSRVITWFWNVVQMFLSFPFPLHDWEYYCLLGTPVKIQYYTWRDNQLHWFDYMILIVVFSASLKMFQHLIIRNDR